MGLYVLWESPMEECRMTLEAAHVQWRFKGVIRAKIPRLWHNVHGHQHLLNIGCAQCMANADECRPPMQESGASCTSWPCQFL